MPNKNDKNYLQYAGLASQMIATLGVAIFIGLKIDRALGIRFPAFLISLALLSLFYMLWKIYKELG
ncbi:MAG: AtpZ/AtpI family protein [Chitinophagaceae bacterium]|nr:AtpZ/AtpI family protein [Chitinophagaceae bacterium]